VVAGKGWTVIGPDPRIAAWAGAALPAAIAAIAAAPDGWRCGGTWHAGVDLLPNAPDGSVGGAAFPWDAVPIDPAPLHRGQISVIRPGYPQPWAGESDAAFGYRLRRDAAHLDGLLAIGPSRQRMIREPHGWILGLPLNICSRDAAPLVVWEGSHVVMAEALLDALAGTSPEDWGEVDLAAAYQAARRDVFARCQRRTVPVLPGQASLVHRLCLHGMAPWGEGASAPQEGRMIAYFRPLLPSPAAWLDKSYYQFI
jgi:hypothetical protein